MKRIFNQLTRLEYEALKMHCLGTGMHERVFYNLKKKTEITVGFLNILYDACGISYDYKTGIMSRLEGISVTPMEKTDEELDKYL